VVTKVQKQYQLQTPKRIFTETTLQVWEEETFSWKGEEKDFRLK